jgi:hypothetical protein
MKWRIYYDDDTTFDNSQGEPWEAPGRGIICVVQIDPSPLMHSVNTQILQGHPFYWYHRGWGYWLHSDRDGFIDQLTNDRKNEVCAIKMGRWVDFHHYREIVDKARSDPDFPKKSGDSKSEHRYKD